MVPFVVRPDEGWLTSPRSAAESAVTIIAASIPVLRTLFKDLHTLSQRYHESDRYDTQNGSKNTEDTDMPRIPAPVEMVMTRSSNSRSRDSGQILQRTEFTVTVEYCKKGGDVHWQLPHV
jgi:hypothetical protein